MSQLWPVLSHSLFPPPLPSWPGPGLAAILTPAPAPRPIGKQYSGHVITLVQSERSIASPGQCSVWVINSRARQPSSHPLCCQSEANLDWFHRPGTLPGASLWSRHLTRTSGQRKWSAWKWENYIKSYGLWAIFRQARKNRVNICFGKWSYFEGYHQMNMDGYEMVLPSSPFNLLWVEKWNFLLRVFCWFHLAL